MGIISNIRKRISDKKQKKINDEHIKSVWDRLKEISSEKYMDDETRDIRKQQIITDFALDVKKGIIILENVKGNDSLEIVENYFKESYPEVLEIGESIRFSQMFKKIEEELEEYMFDCKNGPERYEKMEKIALEFYEKYPKDKTRNLSLNPLTKLEKYNIICSYFERGIRDEEIFLEIQGGIKVLARNKTIREIRNIENIDEQERLYNEFIRDFYEGIEDPEEWFVEAFEDSEFIKRRNKIKKCKEYEVEYEGNPPIIYETDKVNEKALKEKNRERAREKLKIETSVKDFVLVRTTNFYPKDGIVETLDKHTAPEYNKSLFKDEIKDAGLNVEEFDTLDFVSRRTSHYTLNGLVASHMYGNFEGRKFIIVEPFEEQINNDGLLSIDESDTYFECDLKLSDKAIILIRLEEYKEMYKDPIKRKQLQKMNIRIFTEDEKIAVKVLLHDLGYVYEELDEWGYSLVGDNPELRYARKLENVIIEEIKRLQEEGKNVESVNHCDSKSQEKDEIRLAKLNVEKIDRFVNLLFENTDVNFSPKYLKRIFQNRFFYCSNEYDEEYHYLDKDIKEPEGLVKMKPKEVFEKVGPEKIKEITQKYNEMILEEHKEARKQKDKELIEKGLMPKEEKEGQEVE